ncbi:MAG TPA: SGNH/GDSL hydrolase family protein [Actinophytocola sp.]|uniref:SGNH/GDSL hydrolase family protein n=1 Tax=Actinophytocola sp. TaxID=1872138 RepID=UPI002DBC21A5|nr:SGNH/GDSL hydrolase family protein [Actinophytocola sp.]HEU5474147.1 SGNH/GDSL hydrolase family protein [Actinophytocola sp.]
MRLSRISFLSLLLGSVTTLALTTPAAAAPLAENYVALGDSYASGTGAGSYGDSGSCLRSANAYGPLWAGSHGATFTNATCSGANSADVLNSQVGALTAATTLVTIAIGGNDIGFSDVVQTCTFGSDSSCVNRVNEARTAAQTTLPGRLDSVYAAIGSRAPSARVIVLGYPRLFSASSCWWFSSTKRNALNNAANELSTIIAGRVAAAGFIYEDTRDNFAGHEVCTGSQWINGIVLPNVVESYHPNASGHRNGYLAALNAITG